MPTRRSFLIQTATAAPALWLASHATPALASEPPVFQRRGRAIGGTDPVAYFTQGAPVDGSRAITHDWMGATWRFASEDHRAMFVADPVRYAPQFGGYCAFAASRGYVAGTRPDAWSIEGGRLYLNANRRVRTQWLAELPDIIAQGEANWPGILG